MIRAKVHFKIHPKLVMRAVQHASVDPLVKCGAIVEAKAKQSMRHGGGQDREPSSPPEPPNVQTGNLRSKIHHGYDRLRDVVVVGPLLSAAYGRIHEFGLRFGGRSYPIRAFMRPALERARRDFPKYFKAIKLRRTPEGRILANKRGTQ